MGCQKDIASAIIEQKADYILALKGNQGNLIFLKKMSFFSNTYVAMTCGIILFLYANRKETRTHSL